MASPGFGATTAPATNQNALIEQKLRLEQAVKGSASWFVLVAVLSIVNSILSMAEAKIQFIFGLGLTQVVDALANQAGSSGVVLDLVINGMIAGVFVLFWNFARKAQKWAWVVGMGLYVVDGILMLLFKDYLAIAFHAWALFRMYNGFKLLPALEQVNRQTATGAVSSTL